MFFSKPDTGFLGVDIGAGGVKLVQLKKEKGRPVLFTYGLTQESHNIHGILERKELAPENITANRVVSPETKSLPSQFEIAEEQVEKFADVLRRVCAAARTTTKVAVASLPVSAVFHAVITLPVVKKEDFEHIFRAEVKKFLPYPIEEMQIEHEVIPDAGELSGRQQRVLVNAAPRTLVAFYTKVFMAAGLRLESLEPESIALTRSLVGRDHSPVMLIDMGAERTNFFIVENAFPLTHHSIQLGGVKVNQTLSQILKLDQSAFGEASKIDVKEGIEIIKHDIFTSIMESKGAAPLSRQEFLDIFDPVIEPIIKEIQYSLELFKSNNQGKRPEKIILTGGSSLFPFLADKISETYQIKCYIGDPWGRVVYQDGLKSVLRSVAPRMSVSIGLALRNVV